MSDKPDQSGKPSDKSKADPRIPPTNFTFGLTNLKPVASSKTITVTFPDGAMRDFPAGTTGLDIAKGISPSLAKRTVAMALDGVVADLSDPIEANAKIEFIPREDPRALELIRHDAAHVLAEAVQDLWPGTQVTIGPVIDYGFYYDFFRNEPFTPEDFPAIEKKMREIIARDKPFTKEVWSRDETKRVFKEKGENFKVELVDTIPEDQTIKIYKQGDWFDLCRGPHMTSTGKVGSAFKLMKVAGAYWRGDFDEADADPHLRHRVRQAGRPRPLSQATRGSREARPSPPGPRDEPLPFPGRRPRRGVLASQGLDAVPAPRLLYASPSRRRLSGGERAADPRQVAVGDVRPLGLVSREHVRGAVGRRRSRRQALVRAQADELPRPRADLQARAEKLSRPAAAPRRIRRRASLRAVGCDARLDARARLHAG